MDKVSPIVIDSEFKSLIPPLSPEEKKSLEDNCLQDGIRDELVVWANGSDLLLVDGHNRYEIAQKHGLSYKINEMSFRDRDDAKIWIIHNQLGRRNLGKYDRSLLVLKLEPLIAAQAKERMSDGGKGKQISADLKGQTRDELAKIAGVSHDTIQKVKTIEKKATPEVKQKLHDKAISINKAFSDIRKVEAIEKSDNDFLKQQVRDGKTTIDQAYRVVTGTQDKSPAQQKKEFSREKREEYKAFQEKKSDGIVAINDIKQNNANLKVIAIEIHSQILRMGNAIDDFVFDLEEDCIDIHEVAAEWSVDNKRQVLDYLNRLIQKLVILKGRIE